MPMSIMYRYSMTCETIGCLGLAGGDDVLVRVDRRVMDDYQDTVRRDHCLFCGDCLLRLMSQLITA